MTRTDAVLVHVEPFHERADIPCKASSKAQTKERSTDFRMALEAVVHYRPNTGTD